MSRSFDFFAFNSFAVGADTLPLSCFGTGGFLNDLPFAVVMLCHRDNLGNVGIAARAMAAS